MVVNVLTFGYGHSGRVKFVPLPMIWTGAMPCSTHWMSARIAF
jgi:hypothetical protein